MIFSKSSVTPIGILKTEVEMTDGIRVNLPLFERKAPAILLATSYRKGSQNDLFLGLSPSYQDMQSANQPVGILTKHQQSRLSLPHRQYLSYFSRYLF